MPRARDVRRFHIIPTRIGMPQYAARRTAQWVGCCQRKVDPGVDSARRPVVRRVELFNESMHLCFAAVPVAPVMHDVDNCDGRQVCVRARSIDRVFGR